jgi:flagellar biosynthesis chaperone FliJ
MSISNIKKILKIKEKIIFAKISKINEKINSSNKNIKQINEYQVAYISASRMHKGLSAYDIQNTQNFVSNLSGVVYSEDEAKNANTLIKNRLVDEWMQIKEKIKFADKKEHQTGIEIAREDEDNANNSMIENKILEHYK